jgi:hypothetical protein
VQLNSDNGGLNMLIKFYDERHQSFYQDMIEKTSAHGDRYHQALFYVLGLTDATRWNVNSLYDFRENVINLSGLNEPWQTGETKNLTRLAFNLFSGYSESGIDANRLYTPYFLFKTNFIEYCFEAVRIRNSRLINHK